MIHIATDQNGVLLADVIAKYCAERSIETSTSGSRIAEESVAVEDLLPPFVEAMRNDPASTGVLICGTGAGVEIGVNRFAGIRASLCHNAQTASWARQYDNANVLCLSGWAVAVDDLPSIMNAWLSSAFDGDAGRTKMLQIFDDWAGS